MDWLPPSSKNGFLLLASGWMWTGRQSMLPNHGRSSRRRTRHLYGEPCLLMAVGGALRPLLTWHILSAFQPARTGLEGTQKICVIVGLCLRPPEYLWLEREAVGLYKGRGYIASGGSVLIITLPLKIVLMLRCHLHVQAPFWVFPFGLGLLILGLSFFSTAKWTDDTS
jgi:hypothetical protein